MGALHRNPRGFTSVAILVMVALAGCRPDRCRGAGPAFELELILPAGVDGASVASLSVDVRVMLVLDDLDEAAKVLSTSMELSKVERLIELMGAWVEKRRGGAP